MESEMDIYLSDIHAGLINESWWLHENEKEITEQSIRNIADFLRRNGERIRNIFLNGDILHIWKEHSFDLSLAQKQLSPLSEVLAELGKQTIYILGNGDDESAETKDENLLRTALNDSGENINLQTPGWVHIDKKNARSLHMVMYLILQQNSLERLRLLFPVNILQEKSKKHTGKRQLCA